VQLDRQSDEYGLAYDDRTATERINSQAKALNIERPGCRRMLAIRNKNTLIYIVINLKAIERVRAAKPKALHHKPCYDLTRLDLALGVKYAPE
jgi:hypothetical protein